MLCVVRIEHDRSEEAIQALRNLLLLVGSLTTCGYVELKPSTASAGSLFQMPGFTIPQPVGKGGTNLTWCLSVLDRARGFFAKMCLWNVSLEISHAPKSYLFVDTCRWFQPCSTLIMFNINYGGKKPSDTCFVNINLQFS